MQRLMTVNDLRRAIQNLPETSPVLISSKLDEWPEARHCLAIETYYDGRFNSSVVCFEVGGYVPPFNSSFIEVNEAERVKKINQR